MDIRSVKEGLKRLFLGRVSVKALTLSMESKDNLEINSLRRSVDVHRLRSSVSVAKANFASWNQGVAKGHRLELFISPPKAKGRCLSLSCKVLGRKEPKRRVKVSRYIKRISSLPQMRQNLASYISDKEKKKGVLALFYPVIEECVVKSALEKESGSLYVWYNPSCNGPPKVLCLVPEPGKRPPLGWRWL
ncbi:hypothetical protein [Dethiosulfovibrio salsuginis]|uniref:Uncharacterized protein n=1 Tax=Dethiosulfovibrio salsuginis TaxID=561720 RepID=A0A1X7JNA4_9BACT|nr:hypothetical protein [Dethiosulfovibrio salsuginis]SMG29716.1 hypothetical protein SAMN06275492_11429 [Dethiosulfovibrio salsuginis]